MQASFKIKKKIETRLHESAAAANTQSFLCPTADGRSCARERARLCAEEPFAKTKACRGPTVGRRVGGTARGGGSLERGRPDDDPHGAARGAGGVRAHAHCCVVRRALPRRLARADRRENKHRRVLVKVQLPGRDRHPKAAQRARPRVAPALARRVRLPTPRARRRLTPCVHSSAARGSEGLSPLPPPPSFRTSKDKTKQNKTGLGSSSAHGIELRYRKIERYDLSTGPFFGKTGCFSRRSHLDAHVGGAAARRARPGAARRLEEVRVR
jgi:hypothetical protein